MEYLKVASEGRASPKREFWASRAQNQRSKKSSSILEAIAEQARSNNSGGIVSATNEKGVVRVKILVKKEDLKQMLEVVRGGGKNGNALQSLKNRLNIMRRRQELRGNQEKASCRISWCPVLQSIPEEY